MLRLFLRTTALLLTVIILSASLIIAIPATASTSEGLTFSKTDLYRSTKLYDKAPNTIEAWIKLPQSASSGRSGVIIGNNGTGNRVISFEIYKSGNPRLVITEAEDKNYEYIFTDVNVCTDKWVHIAIVRNEKSQSVDCYINGELKQTLPITDGIWSKELIPARAFCVGGDTRTDNPQYFKGAIREIAIFSTARTKEQISSDMNSPAGQSGLLAYYDLSNQNAGTNIPDKSGNEHNVEYIKNETWLSPKSVNTPKDYAYSFVVVGDTQKLNYSFPNKFPKIYDWILENIESKKIKYVFGLGDITDTSAPEEWERAKENIHRLDGKVDYSIVRGNHDTAVTYKKAFPWSEYKDSFDGSYDNSMMNTYKTLSIGDVKYLLINLDFGPSDALLKWAGKLCEEYPDHNVIITTHAYLYINGLPIDDDDHCPPVGNGGNNNGDDMWNKLVSKYENITLVLSGHEACNQVLVTQSEGKNGNIVTQMLVNPQLLDRDNEGLGLVAILYFSEDGRDVSVEYYSTVRKRYFQNINQFSFTLDCVGNKVQTESLIQTETIDTSLDTSKEDTEIINDQGCNSSISANSIIILAAIVSVAYITIPIKKKLF